MKKLSEMTANELLTCIAEVADPAERIYSDCAVIEALDEYTKKLQEKPDATKALSLFTKILLPKLMGKHSDDAYTIVGALNGKTAEEIGAANGRDVLRDMFVIFGLERDIEGLFRPCCEARG